jgi:hypothetical protein
MAKTLRTSGDYTVKAGDGSAGSNTIRLDAKYVRIPGDLTIDGTQTVINSSTLTVEDQFIEVNRNNSTAGTEDSGILFNQGSSNNQILYYDADQSEFVIGTTTHDASVTAITNITPGNIRVAEPAQSDHAATKNYVDSTVSGGGFSIGFRGDDSAVVSVASGNSVLITGGTNLSTAATEEDTVTISLDTANGTGSVIVDDVLTFSGNASTPTAGSITKIYSKAVSGGGTGVYFINSAVGSGTEDELISKKKATALAIALG